MTRPQVLPDDIKTARAAGITTIISLLEPDEAAKIGLQDEPAACAANGITFLDHPIRDMHLPEPAAFTAFAATIANRIQDGEHAALHCYASIGRSGMLTCAILAHFGFDAEAALAHTSKMRGTEVPDTHAQASFIHQIMVGKAS
ncbi:hypothetical protein [uncultured Sulfitobacter sp.]|uniref:protein-tyrosine phosphatase family protein n=1 Tax=uncultured Sulfitobacter sp. TaxID=191468 RepID=UPI0026182977|nr:hypothetical protein [uncultured Sulfitobacter sp.]